MTNCSRTLLLVLFVACVPGSGQAEEKKGFFDPIEKQLEGWTLAVDPKLLAKENEEVAEKAFVALANHLQRVKYIVPADRLAQLQKLRIWIDFENPTNDGS